MLTSHWYTCSFCDHARAGKVMCGFPSMDAITEKLTSAVATQSFWNTKVTKLSWNPKQSVWSIAGVIGATKDSGLAGEEVGLGEFDAIAVADAALARSGSAGQAQFNAEGWLPYQPAYSMVC
jgi:hypothetical protein